MWNGYFLSAKDGELEEEKHWLYINEQGVIRKWGCGPVPEQLTKGRRAAAEQRDLGGRVVLPGLVVAGGRRRPSCLLTPCF